MTDPDGTRKLQAILAADVAGYSRLMQDNERATVGTLEAYRIVFREKIQAHHGRIVDTSGDSVLAVFESPVEAAEAAIEIQGELARRNRQLAEYRSMRFRIGLNLGDVIIREDGTVYGDGINIAARLESLAEPGGICLSGSMYDQIEGKLLLAFKFIGNQTVKNIAKPIRTYRALLEPSENSQQNASRFRPKRATVIFAVLSGAVLIVASAGWFAGELRIPKDIRKDDPVLAMPTGPSIAVLPFENLTGDPKQEYFVDGITEQIITALTRFRDLLVIARNSTFRFKGQAVDVRQVGRDLGAQYVLEGSIRRAAQTIRVTAQLLDAKSGAHLWAESYERKLTVAGILGVQDDISDRVVGAIAGAHGVVSRATFEQAKGKATTSLDAYECVLRWYDYQRGSIGPQEHLKVRDCLERAVKLDPNYADAWAMLSWAYVEEHQQGFNPRPDPLGRALDAARRAIDLAPTHQRSYEALANVYFFKQDLNAFFPLAERSVQLNPNNTNTLAEIGTLIVFSGLTNPARRDRGLALVKKAMALNPSYPDWYHFPVAWTHWWKGEYELALTEAKQINLPDYFWTHMLQAAIYGALDQKTKAEPPIANLLKLYPDLPQKIRAEWRKWSIPDEVIDRAIVDLRRAGMSIPIGT
jgi:adenylate cyclase